MGWGAVKFSSLQQQETPFDNDVSFEASDDEEDIPAMLESESGGEEGDEEYEQLPGLLGFWAFITTLSTKVAKETSAKTAYK